MKIIEKIKMNNGILVYTADMYILVGIFGDSQDHRYAAVLEVRNHELYRIPRFVWTSSKEAGDYTDEDIRTIYRACAEMYSGFADILDLQNKPPEDLHDNKAAADYLRSPVIGIFDVPSIDELDFDLDEAVALGAYIDRAEMKNCC